MRIKMISSPLPYPYSIRVCVCRVCRVCILYFADDIEQVYAINLHKIQSVQSIRIELYVSLFFLCTFNLRPHFNIEPLNESTCIGALCTLHNTHLYNFVIRLVMVEFFNRVYNIKIVSSFRSSSPFTEFQQRHNVYATTHRENTHISPSTYIYINVWDVVSCVVTQHYRILRYISPKNLNLNVK